MKRVVAAQPFVLLVLVRGRVEALHATPLRLRPHTPRDHPIMAAAHTFLWCMVYFVYSS